MGRAWMAWAVVLAGCWGSSETEGVPPRGELATLDPSPAAARSAGASAGAAGCAAIRPNVSNPPEGAFDSAAFPSIGGPALMLTHTCARCGWSASDDACRSLVYGLPLASAPSYVQCL